MPDVYVVRLGKGKWQVELNPDVVPKIRVNALYSGMVKRADESTDNISMRTQLQNIPPLQQLKHDLRKNT